MKNEVKKPAQKPGLLCEDANALEVKDIETGKTTIIKTPDRAQTAESLNNAPGKVKPIHG